MRQADLKTGMFGIEHIYLEVSTTRSRDYVAAVNLRTVSEFLLVTVLCKVNMHGYS